MISTTITKELKLNSFNRLFSYIKNTAVDIYSVSEEIDQLYDKHHGILEKPKKWIAEFNSKDDHQMVSRLFELIAFDCFDSNKKLGYDTGKWPIRNLGKNKIEPNPDFLIKIENQELWLDATCVSSGLTVKLPGIETTQHINITDYKLRITNAVDSKTEQHKDIVIKHKQGYILFISTGFITRFTKPDLYNLVHLFLGLGDFTYHIGMNSRKIVHAAYEQRDVFHKNENSPISHNLFSNKQNSWISAVILSSTSPFNLLKSADKFPWVHWPDKKKRNDFVLVHNPYADYPVKKNILPVSTEIFCETEKIMWTGKNIFPEY